MTHFTASGGYRIKLQINYRSSVGQGRVCLWVGVGGCLQVLPGIPVREPLRASVSSLKNKKEQTSKQYGILNYARARTRFE